MAIGFFLKEVNFRLPHPRKTKSWINKVAAAEGRSVSQLNVVFCSDSYLLTLNQQYLRHDTYTDVITFDYGDNPAEIEGEIFISIERVMENARALEQAFEDELDRVIIHGLLHLLGYSDKTKPKIKEMRRKEDAYLSLR